VLLDDEGVDWRNHNFFIAVNYEWLCDVLQVVITTGGWYGSPFSDRGKLGLSLA
jgi:hypothetical protein